MSGLEYEYYEVRTWGWLGLYRGQEITWHYFSNPNDITRFLYRLSGLQSKKLQRVRAYAGITTNGKHLRILEPHEHDFIQNVH